MLPEVLRTGSATWPELGAGPHRTWRASQIVESALHLAYPCLKAQTLVKWFGLGQPVRHACTVPLVRNARCVKKLGELEGSIGVEDYRS